MKIGGGTVVWALEEPDGAIRFVRVHDFAGSADEVVFYKTKREALERCRLGQRPRPVRVLDTTIPARRRKK